MLRSICFLCMVFLIAGRREAQTLRAPNGNPIAVGSPVKISAGVLSLVGQIDPAAKAVLDNALKAGPKFGQVQGSRIPRVAAATNGGVTLVDDWITKNPFPSIGVVKYAIVLAHEADHIQNGGGPLDPCKHAGALAGTMENWATLISMNPTVGCSLFGASFEKAEAMLKKFAAECTSQLVLPPLPPPVPTNPDGTPLTSVPLNPCV